jgi:protein transport protein SEC61 subunit alpha
VYFFTQILAQKFRGNFIVGLLGKWQDYDMAGHQAPIGGLAYYISPPQSFYDIQKDPLHAFVYTIFVLSTCGFFSRIWIDISNSSSRDLARQFTENDLMLLGQREKSMIKELDRYIPTAAITGGICIGLLSIFADFLGAIGSGTGILLAVTIISQYFE